MQQSNVTNNKNRYVFLIFFAVGNVAFLLGLLVLSLWNNPDLRILWFFVPILLFCGLWWGIVRNSHLVITIGLWLLLAIFVSGLITLWQRFDFVKLTLVIFYAILITIGRKEFLR